VDRADLGTPGGMQAERPGFDPAFPFYVVLILCLITATIALVSVTGLRASQAGASTREGGPTWPLAITSVGIVQGGGDGTDAWVAATATSLVAAFEGSANWHPDTRQCLPDVTGTVDGAGNAHWLGQAAGHLGAIEGDASSGFAYATGLGEYCQAVAHTSSDGGSTWATAPLPAGLSSDPIWLRFDPARPGTLLAAGDGHLSVSRDAGLSWTAGLLNVEPLSFDQGGSLYGWSPGSLYASVDDAATWQVVGEGPKKAPAASAGLKGGLLVAGPDGAWWYPSGAPPVQVATDAVLAAAAAGDGAVVAGLDSAGHPWLGAFSSERVSGPAIRRVVLPAPLATMAVSKARVAADDSGALVAFVGSASTIAFAAFAR
jgi:hypothetical protein